MADPTDRLDDLLAFLDERFREAAAREAAHVAWLDEAAPQIAAELTEKLIPADLRAAGVRFEWMEQR